MFPPTDWPDYDPPPVAFGAGDTVLLTDPVRLLGLCFCNTSGAARQLTLKNAAGVIMLNAVDLPESGISFEKEYPFLNLIGVTITIIGGGGVNGKAWGWLV